MATTETIKTLMNGIPRFKTTKTNGMDHSPKEDDKVVSNVGLSG